MRYLKTYESFDDNRPSTQNNIEDEVNDILLELTDDGFEIDTFYMNYTPPMLDYSLKSLVVEISITNQQEIFRWNHIKDAIERLEEYCFRKDGGYGIDISVFGDYMHLDRFLDVYGGEEFTKLTLYIYSEDDYNDALNKSEVNESFSKWTGLNHEYNIYDFFNDLNLWNKSPLPYSSIKTWTDHFIGDGFYDKIDNHVTKMYDSIKKVDLDNINDRFLELWDDITYKDNWILPSITYGDYYRIDDNDDRYKFNGSMPISDINNDDRRKTIISEIIRAIISPTLLIGYRNDRVNIRNTKDELYVTDEKYQCINFDFSNYSYYRGYNGDNLLWQRDAKDNKYDKGVDSDSIVSLATYETKKYEKYSPDNVILMYEPCISINIGENGRKLGMTLSELEDRLDEIMETVLVGIDYKDVIWDMSRNDRRAYSSDTFDVHEYRLKILLK